MNFVEVIARKRDGGALTRPEIEAFVAGASKGTIGDEQLAALLMAICLRGADAAETQALVESMRDSGEKWGLGEAAPEAVDKHSTGGVGDTVSLVFAPLVASCGVPVAMMAGAGLGHTQGTLDKLNAIPGFVPARSRDEALERLRTAGVCVAMQTDGIAPADRKLYALRDLTATVPSLPLIVGSIMSKKLAVGASRLVLDVKCGNGAFARDREAADRLAEALVGVATGAGVEVRALITDMTQPLGDRLGCALEVRAAVEVLAGGGDLRLREATLVLAEEALLLAGRGEGEARAELERALASGAAATAYDAMVRAHGGDPDPARLARSRRSVTIRAERGGFVGGIDAEALGWIAVSLGAGRRRRGDAVDPAAGVVVRARIGDRIEVGAPLVVLEVGEREVELDVLSARARAAFSLADAEAPRPPLVVRRLGGSA